MYIFFIIWHWTLHFEIENVFSLTKERSNTFTLQLDKFFKFFTLFVSPPFLRRLTRSLGTGKRFPLGHWSGHGKSALGHQHGSVSLMGCYQKSVNLLGHKYWIVSLLGHQTRKSYNTSTRKWESSGTSSRKWDSSGTSTWKWESIGTSLRKLEFEN